jgi:hypothetical protein
MQRCLRDAQLRQPPAPPSRVQGASRTRSLFWVRGSLNVYRHCNTSVLGRQRGLLHRKRDDDRETHARAQTTAHAPAGNVEMLVSISNTREHVRFSMLTKESVECLRTRTFPSTDSQSAECTACVTMYQLGCMPSVLHIHARSCPMSVRVHAVGSNSHST